MRVYLNMKLLQFFGIGGTRFFLPGEPPSAYNTKKAKKRFDYVLAMDKFVPKRKTKHSDSYSLSVIFHTKFREPKRDLDNMLKCVMDALWRGGAIYDDWNVKEIHISVKFPSRKVGTEIRLYEL